MNKGSYQYLFDCRSCVMTEERRCNTMYCVPIVDGKNPLVVDEDKRMVSCSRYKPKEAEPDQGCCNGDACDITYLFG